MSLFIYIVIVSGDFCFWAQIFLTFLDICAVMIWTLIVVLTQWILKVYIIYREIIFFLKTYINLHRYKIHETFLNWYWHEYAHRKLATIYISHKVRLSCPPFQIFQCILILFIILVICTLIDDLYNLPSIFTHDNIYYYIMILFKQFYWISCCHLTFRKIWYCLIKTCIDLVSLSFSFNVIKQLQSFVSVNTSCYGP